MSLTREQEFSIAVNDVVAAAWRDGQADVFTRSATSRLTVAAVLTLYREALEDARRWEEYAHHAAGCVECGQTSWENCFDGKTLRDAAMATDAPTTEDE